MIYKLEFESGYIEWCTAKDQLHLLKSYDSQVQEIDLQEIESIEEISDETAKTIMVLNDEYNPEKPDDMPEKISLYELGGNTTDFTCIANNEA